jgi:hypothetical protein
MASHIIGEMHLAKGLEARAVAVMACDNEVIPLQFRIESAAEESELGGGSGLRSEAAVSSPAIPSEASVSSPAVSSRRVSQPGCPAYAEAPVRPHDVPEREFCGKKAP